MVFNFYSSNNKHINTAEKHTASYFCITTESRKQERDSQNSSSWY